MTRMTEAGLTLSCDRCWKQVPADERPADWAEVAIRCGKRGKGERRTCDMCEVCRATRTPFYFRGTGQWWLPEV